MMGSFIVWDKNGRAALRSPQTPLPHGCTHLAPCERYTSHPDMVLYLNARCGRHIEQGRGDEPCLIWEGNEPGQGHTLSFKQTLAEVCKLVRAAS